MSCLRSSTRPGVTNRAAVKDDLKVDLKREPPPGDGGLRGVVPRRAVGTPLPNGRNRSPVHSPGTCQAPAGAIMLPRSRAGETKNSEAYRGVCRWGASRETDGIWGSIGVVATTGSDGGASPGGGVSGRSAAAVRSVVHAHHGQPGRRHARPHGQRGPGPHHPLPGFHQGPDRDELAAEFPSIRIPANSVGVELKGTGNLSTFVTTLTNLGMKITATSSSRRRRGHASHHGAADRGGAAPDALRVADVPPHLRPGTRAKPTTRAMPPVRTHRTDELRRERDRRDRRRPLRQRQPVRRRARRLVQDRRPLGVQPRRRHPGQSHNGPGRQPRTKAGRCSRTSTTSPRSELARLRHGGRQRDLVPAEHRRPGRNAGASGHRRRRRLHRRAVLPGRLHRTGSRHGRQQGERPTLRPRATRRTTATSRPSGA